MTSHPLTELKPVTLSIPKNGADGLGRAASNYQSNFRISGEQHVQSRGKLPALWRLGLHAQSLFVSVAHNFEPRKVYLAVLPFWNSFAPTGLVWFLNCSPRAALALRRLPWAIFFSPFQGLSLFHSIKNSFHSAMPCALRMSAMTGSSFGARTEPDLR